MIWTILFDPDFELDFQKLDENVQDELLAQVILLRTFGPSLGRPSVDTLKGSIHANMKELRYVAHNGTEIWRAAFAFDPVRKAVILVAGDKQGQDEQQFYSELLRKANTRYGMHLRRLSVEPIPLRKPSSKNRSNANNRTGRRSR